MLKRIFTSVIFAVLMLAAPHVRAQNDVPKNDAEQLAKDEDTLVLMADSMYNALIPDMRPSYCEQFVRRLVKTLKIPNSYTYPFDKLKEKINLIYPEDKSFRMFNWVISPSEMSKRYYGAIQLPSEKLKLYPLFDYSAEVAGNDEDTVLTGSKWYGCICYRIITHELDGKPLYTMFGMNESSPITNKKLMDPMTLTADGPVFGAQVFGIYSKKHPSEMISRFVLEYKKGVQVGLNWDDEMKAVYYDRLVSQINDPNRKYTFVPSGDYDGFKWNTDKWVLVHDLITVQPLKDGEAPSGAPIKDK
jgi:hypothetical protein